MFLKIHMMDCRQVPSGHHKGKWSAEKLADCCRRLRKDFPEDKYSRTHKYFCYFK